MDNITIIRQTLAKIEESTKVGAEFILEAEAIIKSSALSSACKTDEPVSDQDLVMANAWVRLPNYVDTVDYTYEDLEAMGKMTGLVKEGYYLHLTL